MSPSKKTTNHHQPVRPVRPQVSGRGEENSFAAIRRHRPDYLVLVIALALLGIGLIVVYSISPALAASRHVSENYFVTKQLLAIGLGTIAFIVFSLLPIRSLMASKRLLIGLSFLGIIAAKFLGEEINGTSRWIQVAGLSFQVAELIKLALVVWLAIFLVERSRKGELDSSRKTLKPLLIILLLIGIFVANPILQSDLGSAGVMIIIMGAMAFSAGLPLKRIALVCGAIMIGLLLMVSTSEYRRERVSTLFNPTQDCQDSGYQSCQALIAVGSGGLFGLGLGKGAQAYGYLPKAANDSIFAVSAEKFGFLGVSLIIGIYIWLFSRLKRIVLRTADGFSQLFVVGVLAWLASQTIINIGAMIGLLPLKGITLPFISYGGTSLVFIMAALGVVFQVSRYTSFTPYRNVVNSGETNDRTTSRRGQRRPYYASASHRSIS